MVPIRAFWFFHKAAFPFLGKVFFFATYPQTKHKLSLSRHQMLCYNANM